MKGRREIDSKRKWASVAGKGGRGEGWQKGGRKSRRRKGHVRNEKRGIREERKEEGWKSEEGIGKDGNRKGIRVSRRSGCYLSNNVQEEQVAWAGPGGGGALRGRWYLQRVRTA
jgi:hypothetical protein